MTTSEFREAFDRLMNLEGGFVLHRNPTEKADTYAGIYRKAHPTWDGWDYLDRGEEPPRTLVEKFYYDNFYRPLLGINSLSIRFAIFEFAVNAGLSTAIKLAQKVCRVKEDGIIGPKTLSALNALTPNDFIRDYALLKIDYYRQLVNNNRKKSVFLLGWLNRVFEGMKSISGG